MSNPRLIEDLDESVRSVMSSVVIQTKPTTTLRALIETLSENDIGVVPVIEGDRLAGIVGERDIIRALADGVDLDLERAGDIMTFSAESVGPDTTVRQARAAMLEGGIRHLPVQGDDGKLIGLISNRDLLVAHAAIAP